jgi:hypothetical protein
MFHDAPAVGFNAHPVLVLVFAEVAVEVAAGPFSRPISVPPWRGMIALMTSSKLLMTLGLAAVTAVEEKVAKARVASVEKEMIDIILAEAVKCRQQGGRN